jgi:hypothetical protein
LPPDSGHSVGQVITPANVTACRSDLLPCLRARVERRRAEES